MALGVDSVCVSGRIADLLNTTLGDEFDGELGLLTAVNNECALPWQKWISVMAVDRAGLSAHYLSDPNCGGIRCGTLEVIMSEAFVSLLRRLPNHMALALAARCARRVLPLYLSFDGVEKRDFSSLERALTVAERTAFPNDSTVSSLRDVSDAVEVAKVAANTAAALALKDFGRSSTAFELAQAAFGAAESASYALLSAMSTGPKRRHRRFEAATNAIHASIRAASHTATLDKFNHALSRDLGSLDQLARDGLISFDPSETGPLGSYWSRGKEPVWWPDAASETVANFSVHDASPIAGPLSVYIDADEYTPEEQGELLALVSELYRLQEDDILVIDQQGMAQSTSLIPAGPEEGGGK